MKFARFLWLTAIASAWLWPEPAFAGSELSSWPPLRLASQVWDPYQYLADGEIRGIAVDVIHCTLDRMGVRYTIQLLPWIRAQRLVEIGQADGFFSASRNRARDAYATLSAPIARSVVRWYLMPDSERDPIHDKSTFVGVIHGTRFKEWLEESGYSNIFQKMTVEGLLVMLKAGRLDAVLANEATVNMAVGPNEASSLRSIIESEHDVGVYFGHNFLDKAPLFLESFNDNLRICVSVSVTAQP